MYVRTYSFEARPPGAPPARSQLSFLDFRHILCRRVLEDTAHPLLPAPVLLPGLTECKALFHINTVALGGLCLIGCFFASPTAQHWRKERETGRILFPR